MNNASMGYDDEQICPNTTNHINNQSGFTLLLVYVVVISLNALILFVIFGVKHRSLRWSLDYLVSFLAITDLVSTLVGVPLPVVAYLQGSWPGSCSDNAMKDFSTFNITCKVFYLFIVWGRLSTMWIITMMCMERFLAITKPFVHRELVTAGRLRKCVYVIWSSMFVYSFLPLVNVGDVSLHWNKHLDSSDHTSSEPAYFFCFIDYKHTNAKDELPNLIYSVVFLLFGFVTLVIVLFCVFFICRILMVRRTPSSKSTRITLSKDGRSSSKYTVNGSNGNKDDDNSNINNNTNDTNNINNKSEPPRKLRSKQSMLQKSRTFITRRAPNMKKFEPEEIQFIIIMLIIAAIFYLTFLPTMLLVLCNIINVDLGETYTFWAMRLTSFVTIANPIVYGCSNKLYRIGCIWVIKSFFSMFCCKKIPIPERLVNPLFSSPDTSLIDCRVSFRPTSTLSRDGCSGIGGMSVQTIAGTGSSLCSLPESKSNLEE